MKLKDTWDVNKYRQEHEPESHWLLRKTFMERLKEDYSEQRLVCLAQVFANMEFLGCRYPVQVMSEVARLACEVKPYDRPKLCEGKDTKLNNFCAQCGYFVFEYCAIHGPPLIVPDTEISASRLPRGLPAAAYTLPDALLHFSRSNIPGAGLGVFSSTAIPPNVRLGPCRGVRTLQLASVYCWKVSYKTSPGYGIDAQDVNNSNWLRYVNCSRHFEEQNLLAYQHRGQIYYRTIKLIERNTELLVFYGYESATLLGIDLSKYFRAQCYDEVTGTTRRAIASASHPSNLCSDEAQQSISQADSPHIPPDSELHTIHAIRSNFSNLPDNIATHTTHNNITNNIGKIATHTTHENVTNHTGNIATHDKGTNNIGNTATHTTHDKVTNHTDNVVHTKSITFNCSFCSYKTNNSGHFKRHVNTKHTKTTSYDCSLCSYKAYQSSTLRQHVNAKHTKTTSYDCSLCSYKTYQSGALRKHVNAKHTKTTSYNCSLCSYKTYYRTSLNKHTKAKHAEATSNNFN